MRRMLASDPMKPAPNLVLVGPMGAGKSSIGRRLATRLDLAFVDCDHRLEEVTGATVPVIFECEGEAGFRARESALIEELLQADGQLLATGGGVVLAEANRRRLRARGFVVWLQVDVEAQLQRLARDRQRPLLAVPDRRATLETLAEARAPLYREVADLAFDVARLDVGTACARLMPLLRDHWQRTEAA